MIWEELPFDEVVELRQARIETLPRLDMCGDLTDREAIVFEIRLWRSALREGPLRFLANNAGKLVRIQIHPG